MVVSFPAHPIRRQLLNSSSLLTEQKGISFKNKNLKQPKPFAYLVPFTYSVFPTFCVRMGVIVITLWSFHIRVVGSRVKTLQYAAHIDPAVSLLPANRGLRNTLHLRTRVIATWALSYRVRLYRENDTKFLHSHHLITAGSTLEARRLVSLRNAFRLWYLVSMHCKSWQNLK